MADKYIIRITAGPGYDTASHVEVPVNATQPVHITSDLMDVDLSFRILGYHGLPRDSPESSPYFSQPPHAYNKDQYGIALRFTPKKPAVTTEHGGDDDDDDDDDDEDDKDDDADGPHGISGANLQFGNDFDHPIRDRLPPGFGTALNMVKWWIDPGIEDDAYADQPYLYGAALSSFNTVHVGGGVVDEARGGLWVDEGGDDDGLEWRRAVGAPDEAKPRMKWALRNKQRWTWRYGRTYAADFFNPYINFAEFALRLPGFHLPMIRYWDGQGLRYVLRNRASGQTYLVILLTLYRKEDVNEDGSLKPAALEAARKALGGHAAAHEDARDAFDEQKALEEARKTFADVHVDDGPVTNDDDVD